MSQFNRPPFASSQCPVSVSRLNPSPMLLLNGMLVCVSERPVWGSVTGLQGSDRWAALLVWSQWGSTYSLSRGLTSLFAAGSHSALWGWHRHASSFSLQHEHKLSTDSCFSYSLFYFFIFLYFSLVYKNAMDDVKDQGPPRFDPNLYYCLSSAEHRRYFVESFSMLWKSTGFRLFKVQKYIKVTWN